MMTWWWHQSTCAGGHKVGGATHQESVQISPWQSLASQWQQRSVSSHSIPQITGSIHPIRHLQTMQNHCVHCRQGMAAACLLEVFKNWNDSLVSWILPIISPVSDPRLENWETVAILQIWWWVIMRTADITTVYCLPLAFLSHPPPLSDID